ncbi:pyrroline-5-carboxylate reductase [Chungangia koreensis]|uniref:Pyrroline-5-carboxylate reductase n=1 Tax=Chungangia koreensis TaxID=752657 RepID=A0ABV8X977_9LACT
MQKILFAGAGSMAEALIHGWIKEGVARPEDIYVMNKSDQAKLESLHDIYGIVPVTMKNRIVEKAELVILAMKPKDIRAAMDSIASRLHSEAVILSVAAGVPIRSIEEGLGKRPIARAMPNTSAAIGLSASAVAFNELVTARQRDRITDLLAAIGTVKEVEEDSLHIVTALSGSGPAYIYYFAEALEQAAIEKGLSKEVARNLIVQTLVGAAEMMKNPDNEPADLRRKVTSPGGTTEAGLRALSDQGFPDLIATCIQQAEARSRELGEMY